MADNSDRRLPEERQFRVVWIGGVVVASLSSAGAFLRLCGFPLRGGGLLCRFGRTFRGLLGSGLLMVGILLGASRAARGPDREASGEDGYGNAGKTYPFGGVHSPWVSVLVFAGLPHHATNFGVVCDRHAHRLQLSDGTADRVIL